MELKQFKKKSECVMKKVDKFNEYSYVEQSVYLSEDI